MTQPVDVQPGKARRPQRSSNLQLTLHAFLGGGVFTVSEVAHRTGLSRPTAQLAVQELASAGWLSTVDAPVEGSARTGRPAHAYRLRPDADHVIGIDMGAHKALVLVSDLAGNIVAEHRCEVQPTWTFQRRLSQLDETIEAALREVSLEPDDIESVVIATPGVVNRDGRVTYAPAIPEWEGVDMRTHMRDVFGFDAHVHNDMQLAAVAEHWCGAGRHADDVVYVHVGRRIGTGLLIGGHPHRGRDGAAGEIGLWRSLPWDGAFEELVGAEVPFEQHGDAVQDVFERAKLGDDEAAERIERFTRRLVTGIAPVIVTINPELVIIGGGISAAGEAIRQPIDRRMPEETAFPPRVVCSLLGDRSSALGAVRMALNHAEEALFDSIDSRTIAR
ncbi:MAG: ROK family transcriptional regulator [Microbacterium sp.]